MVKKVQVWPPPKKGWNFQKPLVEVGNYRFTILSVCNWKVRTVFCWAGCSWGLHTWAECTAVAAIQLQNVNVNSDAPRKFAS